MIDRNGDLPNGWVQVTIEELCDLNPKHDYALSDETPVSFVPMAAVSDVLGTITELQVRTLGEVRKGYTHFADGDVIFAKITPCMENGKAASVRGMTNGLACGTTEFYVFRSRGAIDQDFLFHFIRQESYRKAARATMQSGVGQARVPKEFVLNTELPLPPLAEQRRIVAKVEALQERSRRAREALSEVGPLLEQFRQSVLAAAFRGDLTADWRAAHPNVEPASELLYRIRAERRRRWEQAELAKYEAHGQKPPKNWQNRYEEPEPVGDFDLQELPDGWCWIRVEELASDLPRAIQSGPFGSNLLHSEFQDTGILAIGIDNVHRDGFSLGQQHRISREKYEELKKYTACPLDVLVTVMATVGRCCLVPADLETAIITKHVYRITLEQRLINPHFLVLGFQGAVGMLKKLAKAMRGQTRPGINGEILKSLAIPVPPRQEQDVICEAVHNQIAGVNNMSELISETTGVLDHLDQSILAKAFRGELVPQDPSDEPASALLIRIRKQKTQQAEAAKHKQKTSTPQRGNQRSEESSRPTPQQLTLTEVLLTKD